MLPISDLHTIIGFCQCRIHNGCDAITLTTFCWLSGTPDQT